MTRKILYRGRRTDNGEWIYGFYIETFFGAEIYEHNVTEHENGSSTHIEQRHCVIPSTVGRYTGLTDKNDVKIFEDDKVRSKDDLNLIGVVKWGLFDVATDYGRLGFYIDWENKTLGEGEVLKENIMFWVNYGIEVIGNIHE